MLKAYVAAALILLAQPAKPAFNDHELMLRFFDTNPRQAVEAVESVCTQEQLDQIEEILTPEPSAEKLKAARRQLREAGISKDDPLIQSLNNRIDGITQRP